MLIRTPRIVPRLHNIFTNNIQTLPLLGNHMCHIPEQFIQLADALFDIPDFALAFYDECFLEIYFALVG